MQDRHVSREEITRITQEAKKTSLEAISIGHSTLNELDRQDEVLQSTQDTLESNEYKLEASMRHLRGMTWMGSIYNLFNPISIDKLHHQNETKVSHNNNVDINSTQEPNIQFNSIDYDADLYVIAQAVDELHRIGMTLGEALSQQKERLETLDKTSSRVYDKTLRVTLTASQLLNRKSTIKPKFVGRYQFEYLSGEGLYLAVDNNQDIVLTSIKDLSTYFNIYMRDDNLYAIQNDKTLSYLSVQWNGTVRAIGQRFDKAEEMYLHLDEGEVTGLLFLSVNWSYGGWLKRPSRPPDTSAQAAVAGSVTLTSEASPVPSPAGHRRSVVLREVTRAVSDKTDQALFLPVLYQSKHR